MLERLQDQFASALRSGDAAALSELGLDADQRARFAVYRNTVVRSAIDALRAAYPSVQARLGEENFQAVARFYWERRPPTAHRMTLYGEALAEVLEQWCGPAFPKDLPGLIAHDRAWLEAHHAENAPAFTASQAAALDPGELVSRAPGLHPSVRLLETAPGHYALWRNLRFDAAVQSDHRYSLVWRVRGEVRHAPLDRGGHEFLRRVGAGGTLETAIAATQEHVDGFNPAPVFQWALSQDVLSGEAAGKED